MLNYSSWCITSSVSWLWFISSIWCLPCRRPNFMMLKINVHKIWRKRLINQFSGCENTSDLIIGRVFRKDWGLFPEGFSAIKRCFQLIQIIVGGYLPCSDAPRHSCVCVSVYFGEEGRREGGGGHSKCLMWRSITGNCNTQQHHEFDYITSRCKPVSHSQAP